MLTLNLDKHQLEREKVKYERKKKNEWQKKSVCVSLWERVKERVAGASERIRKRERVSEPLFWVE